MDIEKLRQEINDLLNEVVQLRAKVALLEAGKTEPSPVLPPVQQQETIVVKKKSDLKSKIGLNDRFRFLNELFGGNSGEFNAAINQLDTIDSIEEADDYLDRLFGVYHWDKAGQTYADFYLLIKQKISQ